MLNSAFGRLPTSERWDGLVPVLSERAPGFLAGVDLAEADRFRSMH